MVLAALALAKYEISHLDIRNAKAIADAHAGLWSWDAGWYSDLAAHGYHAVGTQGLRFFPLFPVVAGAIHHVTFLPVDAVTGLISNASALAATMALYLLAKIGVRRCRTARSAAWLLNLVRRPSSLVMGYSDSLVDPAGRDLFLPASATSAGLPRRRWASWPAPPGPSAAFC